MVGVWATGISSGRVDGRGRCCRQWMTCSAKLSSARSECKMEVTVLLQRGHLGVALSPAHDALVAECVEARHHVAGLLPAVQAVGTAVVQLCGRAPACCCVLGGAGDDKLLPLTGAAAAGVALLEEERPQSVAGPGRAGRSAQVPAEGNPPSCPG